MDKFCILPWIHLSTSSQGDVSMCCVSQGTFQDEDNYNLNRNSIDDAFNSPFLRKVRQQFLKGEKPKYCNACWSEEDAGIQSKRIRENARWDHLKHKALSNKIKSPVFLDLKLGNVCNLRCRICDPLSSSQHAQEQFKITNDPEFLKFIEKGKWVEEERFWNEMESILPGIEMIEFFGGEPFLLKEHERFIAKCVEKGYASNISLHYNTNGAQYPTRIVEELHPEFKDVTLMLSMDGIGKQFEYNRFPAKWNVFEENLDKFKEQNIYTISICSTISVFTLLQIPEMVNFSKDKEVNFWPNTLHYPLYYNIGVFPLTIKEEIQKKIMPMYHHNVYMSKFLQMMFNVDHQKHWPEFLNITKKLDIIRDNSFKDTFPELHEIMEKTGYGL